MKLRRWTERIEGHVHTGLHEVVHWLYDPMALGKKSHRVRWYHVHLIPSTWLGAACERYDRKLGVYDQD